MTSPDPTPAVDSAPLRVERRDDGVIVLTLALPERRNAMTAELTAAWTKAVADLRGDRSVRCVVVTGEGRAFCAGGDLSWINAGAEQLTPDGLRDRMYPFYRAWLAIRDLEVPVVAAVNGAAVGAGLCLALACDIRVASSTATFSAPFTKLGMHPGMAATWLLPEAVGVVRARELLFTGSTVDAAEAERIGLVSRVVEPAELLTVALELASSIAAAAPVATRLTKTALLAGPRSLAEALEWEALAQPVTMATGDLREGLRAAGEKRAPVFEGR